MLTAIFSSARQCFHVSGHGVIATAAPRMTAKQSAESQIRALQRSVLAQCLYGILGTSGRKTTGWRRQGRDVPLIATDGKHQKCHQPLAQMLPAPSKECPHDVRFTTLKIKDNKTPETSAPGYSIPVVLTLAAPPPAIQQKTQPRSNGRLTEDHTQRISRHGMASGLKQPFDVQLGAQMFGFRKCKELHNRST